MLITTSIPVIVTYAPLRSDTIAINGAEQIFPSAIDPDRLAILDAITDRKLSGTNETTELRLDDSLGRRRCIKGGDWPVRSVELYVFVVHKEILMGERRREEERRPEREPTESDGPEEERLEEERPESGPDNTFPSEGARPPGPIDDDGPYD